MAAKDDGERSVIAESILDRDVQADLPNQMWLAGATYIWTAEGRLNVAAVLDGRRENDPPPSHERAMRCFITRTRDRIHKRTVSTASGGSSHGHAVCPRDLGEVRVGSALSS